MKYTPQLKFLIPLIIIGAAIESLAGIYSHDGVGSYTYQTIRNQTVEIYGKGVYRHMTTEVAVQGIAQDYATLLVAIPLLLLSFYLARRGSLRSRLVLLGTLLYFTLTYLFYIGIAMYNELFLVAAGTLFCSLFGFILTLMSFDFERVQQSYSGEKIMRTASIFLMVMAVLMAGLWLSVIVPPMLDGSFYPKSLAHYSTLIVQGYDFGIFLPLAFISGVLGLRKNEYASVLVPMYLVFLSILMIALVSKIVFMANVGANVIPVIFVIPIIFMIALTFAIKVLKSVGGSAQSSSL